MAGHWPWWPDGNPPVQTTDVVAEVVPGVESEKIGFAFRISDSRLVAEFNEQLAKMAGEKRGLINRFFAQPEAFLGN